MADSAYHGRNTDFPVDLASGFLSGKQYRNVYQRTSDYSGEDSVGQLCKGVCGRTFFALLKKQCID